METSDLTILLFFLIVLFFLASFLLYIFISRRTTPASQRLTQWLKAQSEADLLVETMASQGRCVVEGLHPCRRRDKMRKRQAAQRRRQHAENGRGNGEDPDGSGGGGAGGSSAGGSGGGGEYDEEMAMDDLWRRYQRQRSEDPATLVVHGAITSGDNGNGGNGGNGVSSENDSTGTRMDHRTTSEDMIAEKLWEYVVGWCLIGCILCGIALITGANFMVHEDPTSATPWTFEPEDGDSLMDNIVANIMKIALGMRDFEDQLMEHGIFVFIVGINGFVLVRQRVFGRRRQHEQELMRGGMLQMGAVKDVGGYDLEGKTSGEMTEGEESGSGDGEGYNEGKRDFYEDVERFTTTDQVPTQTGASSTTPTTIPPGTGVGGGFIANTPTAGSTEPRPSPIPATPAVTKAKDSAHSKELIEDMKSNGDDNSPDFATMSFLAWFNYLQVGVLIIEFLQLFSFPLRELMEFYNQAEKTSTMYEGAKTILDVFRTTAMDPSTGSGQVPSASGGTSGIQYKDGILSIGNNTLFDFNPRNSSTQDKKSTERPSFALEMSEGDEGGGAGSEGAVATVLDQDGDSKDLLDKTGAPQTEGASEKSIAGHQGGGGGGGGAQKLGASANWIKENFPSWLPNITALMDNNTVDGLEPGRFEELRDNLVNAAMGVALQGFVGTNSSSTGSDAATISSGGVDGSGDSGIAKSPTGRSRSTSNSGGDGDIVMQVVNSLGLQPTINTHDWYLLRFWSCFAAVALGWIVALSIHSWNRRCRRLRREGRPHWNAISVGWVSCFIPVVSVLYLPILSTFLSSAACQSQAIHAYAHEKYAQQQEQARRHQGPGSIQATGIFNSVIMTLLDPASTVAAPSASSLLCTGPKVQPALYLTASLFAYTLAYVLFMVFLTSFERVPARGEICFRPNGVAVLKNLGLLLAVDFLLIQSPSQRRFRGLVSIGIMLAMACYTIRMKPCYWNKINYWRTFSFSCVLYASLLVALLCPSPALEKSGDSKARREHRGESKSGGGGGEGGLGRWVMAPHLKMGLAWMVGGGPKMMLAWIAAGWVLLVIVFVVVERVFLRHWTKKVAAVPVASHHVVVRPLLASDGYGGYRSAGGGGGGGVSGGVDVYGGPDFRSLRGGGVGGPGDMGAFAPGSPSGGTGGGGGGVGGLSNNPTMSGSHWSVVDLSQTPEVRRSKALGSS